MKKKIKQLIEYFKTGVWQKKSHEFKNKKGFWLTRTLQVVIYTLKGVNRHGSFIRSAALTFYTVMSLVPILALAFGIIKGFGLEGQLTEYLLTRFPQYEDMVRNILDFAGGVINRTRSGVVAITGVVMLIWAAVRVFVNVEGAFNAIWEVKRQRSFVHKFSAYIGVIFIVPLLWVGVSGMVVYAQNVIKNYSFLPNALLSSIGSFLIIWIVFALIYKAVPYTKVKWKSAIVSGGLATVAFLVFQMIYIYIQNSVTAYNVIYGSFAAVPLFLLWLQVSWQIVLMGAEVSFSLQNIESYMQERQTSDVSYDNRRKITLAGLLIIVRNFAQEKGGMTSEEVAKELEVPLRLTRDVLYDLEDSGVLMSTRSSKSDKVNIYLPARDIHSLSLYSVLMNVEEHGNDISGTLESSEFEKVDRIIENMKRHVCGSKYNVPLMDLLENESNDTGERKCG